MKDRLSIHLDNGQANVREADRIKEWWHCFTIWIGGYY